MGIEVDATFIALVALVIFGVLMLVLKVPAMIAGMLDSQSQAIAKELAEARRLREEAERLLAQHQAQLDAAKAEAEALVAAAKEQAQALGVEARANLADSINGGNAKRKTALRRPKRRPRRKCAPLQRMRRSPLPKPRCARNCLLRRRAI